MAKDEFMQQFMSFLQQKGFVWGPSPEIYGGLAGFYTYGPLGKLLKNNVENTIRRVFRSHNFWEVECPTIMQKEVWEASGHLSNFTDPMVECSGCGSGFRIDTLIEEKLPGVNVNSMSHKELLELLTKKKITCPECKKSFKKKVIAHNLMMGTTIGVNTEAYSRPETATTTYLPFPRYHEFFRKKLPFSVFQIGKVYRNEISPRQHLLRCREFTQAEGQLFLFDHQRKNFPKFAGVADLKLPLWSSAAQKKKGKPSMMSLKQALKKGYLKNEAFAWTLSVAYQIFQQMGIPEKSMRIRQHHDDEKAFYADDAWDIEVELNSFGWTECCGVHDRTNYDLTQHAKASGKKLSAFDEETGSQHVPYILEIAFGSDRPTFALLDLFYTYHEKGKGMNKFNVPYHLAPVSVAIFPLMKKKRLPAIAQKIYQQLSSEFCTRYDDSGSIGRRYLREDESGTPLCVTVDFDSTKQKDVTVRDRNTGKQKRVKITDLASDLKKRLTKDI